MSTRLSGAVLFVLVALPGCWIEAKKSESKQPEPVAVAQPQAPITVDEVGDPKVAPMPRAATRPREDRTGPPDRPVPEIAPPPRAVNRAGD
jgi:hypothetical protein